jgi:asparagine synthase (glutamine-hydrolysing)
MCGIAGILSSKNDLKDLHVRNMVAALTHRGPDDESFWKKGSYSAGMRRLSINDPDGGGQPLFDSTEKIVLFYNGEIYNSPQLRAQLISEGYKFKTGSDGEVICHLYRKFGKDFLTKIDGMFAIALWDDDKQILILSRDFPGEKPLYYSQLPCGGFAFSSEISSLIKCSSVSREYNFQAIWDLPTFLWVPEPSTIYQNILAVMPGECIVISCNNKIQLTSFVNQLPRKILSANSTSESLVASVKEVVTDAVKSRLLSDVPVGAFLSGGLDSSIICSIAKKELSQLHTFCVGFENLTDPYHGYSNESAYAEAFATQLGSSHKTIRVNSDDFRKLLPQLLKAAGQPYAVSSGLGILAVAKESRNQGIKVLLSGDGADEAFGGYAWYKYLSKVFDTKPRKSNLERFLDGGDSLNCKMGRMGSYSPQERAWAWHYYASEQEKIKLFSEKVMANSSLRFFDNYKFDQPINFLEHDRKFYFPNEMLSKVDRMTMAYSVEGRAPFAAPSVQLLASQLPFDLLYYNQELKWILREAFRSELPPEIINRQKHGFNVPIDHWLKHEWKDLFEETFSNESYLSRNHLINSGARDEALKILNNPKKIGGHVIFSYVMLNLWMTENEK